MYDVERVEISRGPQGTLFGRNSTAGSVNVISARPNFDKQEGKIEVEVGKYAQRTVKGWFNLPVNDVLALRASVLKETADTWYNQTQDKFDLAWDPMTTAAPLVLMMWLQMVFPTSISVATAQSAIAMPMDRLIAAALGWVCALNQLKILAWI